LAEYELLFGPHPLYETTGFKFRAASAQGGRV